MSAPLDRLLADLFPVEKRVVGQPWRRGAYTVQTGLRVPPKGPATLIMIGHRKPAHRGSRA